MGKTSKKNYKTFGKEKNSKKVENSLKNDVIQFRLNGAYCTLCQLNIKFNSSSDAAQEIHSHLSGHKHTKRLGKVGPEGKIKTVVRCGKCKGCQNPACNVCKYCLDNINEEGPKLKQRCLSQKCLQNPKIVAVKKTGPSVRSNVSTWGAGLEERRGNDVVKWVLSAITSAIREHRWEDAATLLPAMILRHEGQITDDFMWRVIDTVSSNAKSIPDGTKTKLRRLMVKMRKSGPASQQLRYGSMHDKVVLDSLAQELIKSANVNDMQEEVDKLENILQMKSQYTSKDRAQTHVEALVIAYQGIYLYAKWKFLQTSNMNNEGEQLQDDTVSSSQEMNSSMWKAAHSVLDDLNPNTQDSSESKVLGNTALTKLRLALEKLEEPCEFALGPFLELLFEINGLDATLEYMELYKNKYPDHLPGKKLLYHVLCQKLGAGRLLQMVLLKEICTICEQDSLVLVYVDQLIQEARNNETISQFLEREHDDNPDSGLDDFSDNSADENGEDENQQQSSKSFNSTGMPSSEYVCSLLPAGYVEILLLCVRLLTRFLEYPQFRDHLPAWQKLTLVLKRIHHAWLRCWYCIKCEQSKKNLRIIRRKINSLWKFIIWKPPANDLSQEEAQLLMNKAYAAHIFCFSEDYILEATAAMIKSGFSYLAQELLGYINFNAPHTEKFKTYRNKRRVSYAFHRNPTFGMREIQQMFGIANIPRTDENSNRIESQSNEKISPVLAVDGCCDIFEGENNKKHQSSQRTDGSKVDAPNVECELNNTDQRKENNDSKCRKSLTFDVVKNHSENIVLNDPENSAESEFEEAQTDINDISPDALIDKMEKRGEILCMKAVKIKNFALDIKSILKELQISQAQVIKKGATNVGISGISKKSDFTKFCTYSHPVHRMEKIIKFVENVILERKEIIKSEETLENSIDVIIDDSDLDDLPMPSQRYTYTEKSVEDPLQKEQSPEDSKLFLNSLFIDEQLFVTSTQVPHENNDINEYSSDAVESPQKLYDDCKASLHQPIENVNVQNHDEMPDESEGESDDSDSDSEWTKYNTKSKPIGIRYLAGLSPKGRDKASDKEVTSITDEIIEADDCITSRNVDDVEQRETKSQDICSVGPHASSGSVYLKQGPQLILAGAVDVHFYGNDLDSDMSQSDGNKLSKPSQVNYKFKDFKKPEMNTNINNQKKQKLSTKSRRNSVRSSKSGSDLDMTVEEEQFDPYDGYKPLVGETRTRNSGFDEYSIIEPSRSDFNSPSVNNNKSDVQNKLSLSYQRRNTVKAEFEEKKDNISQSNTQNSNLTCGQHEQEPLDTSAVSRRRDNSSGYKAGSSGEHEISPVSQDHNDSSVFFQYTELPTNLPSSPLDQKGFPKKSLVRNKVWAAASPEPPENKPTKDLDICVTTIPETQVLSQDIVSSHNQLNNMERIGDLKTKFNACAELSFIPGNEELDILDNTLDSSIPLTCGQRESFYNISQGLDGCIDDKMSNNEEYYSSKSTVVSDDCTIVSDSCSDSDDTSENRLSQNSCYLSLAALREANIEKTSKVNDHKQNSKDILDDVVFSQNDNGMEIVKQNVQCKTEVIGESNDSRIFDHSPVKPTKPFTVLTVRYPDKFKGTSAKNISDDETDDEDANRLLENQHDKKHIPQVDDSDNYSDVFCTATEDEENLCHDTQDSNKELKNMRSTEKKVLQTQSSMLVSQVVKKSKKDMLSVEEEAYMNMTIDKGRNTNDRRIQCSEYPEYSEVTVNKCCKKNRDILSLTEEVYKDIETNDQSNASVSIQVSDNKSKKKKKKYKDTSFKESEMSIEETLLYKEKVKISHVACAVLHKENKLCTSVIEKEISVSYEKKKRKKSKKNKDDLISREEPTKCITNDNFILEIQNRDCKDDQKGKTKKSKKKNVLQNEFNIPIVNSEETLGIVSSSGNKIKSSKFSGTDDEMQPKKKKREDNEVEVKKAKKSKKNKKEKHEKLSSISVSEEHIGRDRQNDSNESKRRKNSKGSKCLSSSSYDNYETCEEEQDLVGYINKKKNKETEESFDNSKNVSRNRDKQCNERSTMKITQEKIVEKNIMLENEKTFADDSTTSAVKVDSIHNRFDALRKKRKEKRDSSHSEGEYKKLSESFDNDVEIKAEITGVYDEVNDWLADELFNIESAKIIESSFGENETGNKTLNVECGSLANSDNNNDDGNNNNDCAQNLVNDDLLSEDIETISSVKKQKKSKKNKKIKKDIIEKSMCNNSEKEFTPNQSDINLIETGNKTLNVECGSLANYDNNNDGNDNCVGKNINEDNETESSVKKHKKSKKNKKIKKDMIEKSMCNDSEKEFTPNQSDIDLIEHQKTSKREYKKEAKKKAKKKNKDKSEINDVEAMNYELDKKDDVEYQNIVKKDKITDESASKKGKKRKHMAILESNKKIMAVIEAKESNISNEHKQKKSKKKHTAIPESEDKNKGSNICDEHKQRESKKQKRIDLTNSESNSNDNLVPIPPNKERSELKKVKISKKQQQIKMSDLSSDVDHLFSMPIASLRNIVEKEKKAKLHSVSSTNSIISPVEGLFGAKQKIKKTKKAESKMLDDLDDLPLFSDEEYFELLDSKDEFDNKDNKNIHTKKKKGTIMGTEERSADNILLNEITENNEENLPKKMKSKNRKMSKMEESNFDLEECYEKVDIQCKELQKGEKIRKLKVKDFSPSKKKKKSSLDCEFGNEVSNSNTKMSSKVYKDNSKNKYNYLDDSFLDDLPLPDFDEMPEVKQHCHQNIDNYKKKKSKTLGDSYDSSSSHGNISSATPTNQKKRKKEKSQSRVAKIRRNSFKEDMSPILPPPTSKKHKLFSPEKTELFSLTPPTASLSKKLSNE